MSYEWEVAYVIAILGHLQTSPASSKFAMIAAYTMIYLVLFILVIHLQHSITHGSCQD